MRVLLTYRDDEWYPKAYIEALAKAGAVTEPLCFHHNKPSPVANDFDGLLLSGGIDIEPVLYGHERHEKTETENGYDMFELDILKAFMAIGRPVLGICRGAQVLGVGLGGTLFQHLPDLTGITHDHSGCEHKVSIENNSKLFELFSTTELNVNSRHHQAVASVPDGVRVSAVSDDGVIECIEHKNMLGVQWHPENLGDAMLPLFAGFVAGFK